MEFLLEFVREFIPELVPELELGNFEFVNDDCALSYFRRIVWISILLKQVFSTLFFPASGISSFLKIFVLKISELPASVSLYVLKVEFSSWIYLNFLKFEGFDSDLDILVSLFGMFPKNCVV